MAATSPTIARRKYSWCWDSHICLKNSKWLQLNLEGSDKHKLIAPAREVGLLDDSDEFQIQALSKQMMDQMSSPMAWLIFCWQWNAHWVVCNCRRLIYIFN